MTVPYNDPTPDVVVYRVETKHDDDGNPIGTGVGSWGRGTLKETIEFCRRPTWPARVTDSFVAADDWGHGKIVAATPDLQTHVGKQYRTFVAELH